MGKLLQSSCLKPQYSLRRQLLVTFGSTAFLTIALAVIMATFAARLAGCVVHTQARAFLRKQVIRNIRSTSTYVADVIQRRLSNLEGAAALQGEIVRDRIVGYPDRGWEDDLHVPFFDTLSQRNVYPIEGNPLPRDWSVEIGVLNESMAEENLQERSDLIKIYGNFGFNTSTAIYRFQGNCDPDETDPSSLTYYPNCKDANNDVVTGGIVRPVETTKYLAQKAAEIGILMKPIWESHPEILLMSVGFSNSGAGSKVSFPAYTVDGTAQYISQGCEWMRQINPLTDKPYGTVVEISRCRSKGEHVNERDYNPLERQWCADQALHPGKVRNFGPFRSSSDHVWLISLGKAVFDRLTGEFIACSVAHIELTGLARVFDIEAIKNTTEIVLVRPDGTIVVSESERWDHVQSLELLNIVDTSFTTPEVFGQFKALWDFDSPWTPGEVSERLQKNVITKGNDVYASLPVPLPPSEYDSEYRPDFYLLLLIGEEIFSPIDEVDEEVENDVFEVVVTAVLIGIMGLVGVALVIWSVSRVLTLPLNWMERVAWRIVNHNDERAGDALHVTEGGEDFPITMRCTPKTEITELVDEFRIMIKGFSGSGASTVARKATNEVRNEMDWHSEFHELYSRLSTRSAIKGTEAIDDEALTDSYSEESSLETPPSPISVSESSPDVIALSSTKSTPGSGKGQIGSASASARVVAAPPRSNKGQNCCTATPRKDEDRLKMHLGTGVEGSKNRVWCSKLFWWIGILIVLPLLATNLAICGLVTHAIVKVLPSWLHSLKDASYDIELSMLDNAASLRASYSGAVMMEPIRDLHLFTRVSGWLLFGGISQSNSITEMVQGTEECKEAEFGECDIYDDPLRTPCDCRWRDPRSIECQIFSNDPRYLQLSFFCGQAQDADPSTGDRNNVSFPLHDVTPNTTLWWTNVSDLPGADRGRPPQGYKTTFDRVGVMSAAAIASVPIHNYVEELGRSTHFLGLYTGFENDGMFTGYSGCSPFEFTEMSKFQSTEENEASRYGGNEICPIGKWGFDPRCRGWYAEGRDHCGIQVGGAVHITAPYLFSTGLLVATSATSAIVDPATGEHVGQSLLDFAPQGLFSFLENSETEISIVVSPVVDATGGDTVLGPGHNAGSDPAAIGDVVLPNDGNDSGNRFHFNENIVADMKNGISGDQRFDRIEDDGSLMGYRISYAPVKIRALRISHADDFSRGARRLTELVYSLGIARPEYLLRQPFEEINGDVKEEHRALLTLYLCLVLILSLLVSMFTLVATIVITKPTIILLHVVQYINSGRIEDDIPPMQGGSAEVNQVYNSFAKLFKIVRVSNSAFFSGNLKWAYHFVNNALQLFRKVDDQKAIGIACNNLGNTMLAICCENTTTGTCCIVDGLCFARRGKELLDEAIEIGTREFENDDSDDAKAHFAQQLANRHFNRAMHLLLTQHDPCALPNAKELGYQDLFKARQLDDDVYDYWLQRKLVLKNSAEYFDRMVRRLRGLVALYADEGVRNIWDVRELVEDLDRLLLAAWDQPSAPLFYELSRVGRLQQLEDAVIRLEISLENYVEAASLGIRMLVEDEFMIESAFLSAANALLAYVKMDETTAWSAETQSCLKADLRKVLKSCKGPSFDAGKCLVLCMELSSDVRKDPQILPKLGRNILLLYDEYFNDDDYVGLVSFSENADDDMVVGLSKKGQQQRALFESATKRTNGSKGSPTIPIGFQIVAESAESKENDTYLLAVIDGSTWGSFSPDTVRRQIDRLNRERNTVINIIIIGLDLKSTEIADGCRELCMVSRGSVFLEADLDTLDIAFDQVSSIITGRSATSGSMLGGITMEKF